MLSIECAICAMSDTLNKRARLNQKENKRTKIKWVDLVSALPLSLLGTKINAMRISIFLSTLERHINSSRVLFTAFFYRKKLFVLFSQAHLWLRDPKTLPEASKLFRITSRVLSEHNCAKSTPRRWPWICVCGS